MTIGNVNILFKDIYGSFFYCNVTLFFLQFNCKQFDVKESVFVNMLLI